MKNNLLSYFWIPKEDRYQVLILFVASLAAMTHGLQTSWTSPFLVKIAADKEHYNISEDETSYFTIIQPLFMIIAAPLMARLTLEIGRKYTLLLIAVPQIIGWVLAATATNIWMFYGMKACAGIASAIYLASLPIYVGEISSPKIRGTWGNLYSTMIYFGQFLIVVMGKIFNVKETSYLCLPFPILFLIIFYFSPETPYYHIMNGRELKAKESLMVLRNREDVEEEYKQLEADVKRQLSESAGWKDLFLIKSNRRGLICGVFLRFSAVLGGLTIFMEYCQFIFEKSGGILDPDYSTITYMGLNFFLNVFGVALLVDKLGRRKCYEFSVFPCFIVLLLMSIYLYIDDKVPEISLESYTWIPLTCMLLFQLFSSFGLGVIPHLMIGELHSASIKDKALSILLLAMGAMMVISNYVFRLLYSNFGLYAPILMISVSNLFLTIIGYFIIPETKGKTLEEIQQMLKSGYY